MRKKLFLLGCLFFLCTIAVNFVFAELPLNTPQTIIGKWKTSSISSNGKPLETNASVSILLNMIDDKKGIVSVQSGSVSLPDQSIDYTLDTKTALLSLKPNTDDAMSKLLNQTLSALNLGFLAQELHCTITSFTEKAMTLTIQTKDSENKDLSIVLELTKN